MLTMCWETGIICPACELEIPLGDEMLYGQHLGCVKKAAQERRDTSSSEDTLTAARRMLDVAGRIMLTRSQLRQLITLASVDASFRPVRRPDKSKGPMQWYGRLSGWSPERVAAGLSAPEVAGLWLDYLEVGRTPPVRHSDLSEILTVISAIDA